MSKGSKIEWTDHTFLARLRACQPWLRSLLRGGIDASSRAGREVRYEATASPDLR
jgi:hypothetical protein